MKQAITGDCCFYHVPRYFLELQLQTMTLANEEQGLIKVPIIVVYKR
jgi:hypothetical protein